MPEEHFVFAAVLKTDTTPHVTDDTRLIVIPPGPVSFEKLQVALRDILTPLQLAQVHAGFRGLRQAYSSELTKHLVLRLLDRGEIARTHVFPATHLARLEQGGALVSLLASLDLDHRNGAGRPELTGAFLALRDAIAMSVARIDLLGDMAKGEIQRAQSDHAKSTVDGILKDLEAPLFNINSSHSREEGSPARTWCEREGPIALAKAYSLRPAVLEQELRAAFAARIAGKGYAAAMDRELVWLKGLADWAQALRTRRKGELSRADTIRRAQAREAKRNEEAAGGEGGEDGEGGDEGVKATAPDGLVPRRMHESVRANLVAEMHLEALSPLLLTQLSALFGVEAAHGVLLVRQYLLPILAISALLGKLVLRRQNVVVEDAITAGGLIALNEGYAQIQPDPHDGATFDEDILALQEVAGTLLSKGELAGALLSASARRFLDKDRAFRLEARSEPRLFFLD